MTVFPPKSLDDRGFTLIEMMMAVAVSGLALIGIYTVVNTQSQAYNAQNQVVDMQGNARTAIGLLSRDLRMAGYSPMQGVTINGITYDPANLLIQADLNGNGVATDPGEYIVYSYNANTLQVSRIVNSVGRNVFPNVQAFTVSYFDSTGTPTTTSANIRQVSVALTARTALPDPNWPANNGFRTFTLQVLVTPRNLGL
jgi:type IV pilus assembly protein PilW